MALVLSMGIYFIAGGKTYEFSEVVIFKIQFSFNKNYIEPDKLKSLKILSKMKRVYLSHCQ